VHHPHSTAAGAISAPAKRSRSGRWSEYPRTRLKRKTSSCPSVPGTNEARYTTGAATRQEKCVCTVLRTAREGVRRE
jgi:hypothetical protein